MADAVNRVGACSKVGTSKRGCAAGARGIHLTALVHVQACECSTPHFCNPPPATMTSYENDPFYLRYEDKASACASSAHAAMT